MLAIYNNTPFDITTEVNELDLFTGDGVSTTFVVVNKSGVQVANTIEFGTTQSIKAFGGFTVVGNDITLNYTPPDNSQGVVPGLTNILVNGIFDQTGVNGNPISNVQQVPFYLIDTSTIYLYTYAGLPGAPGIEMLIVDNISGAGADLTWVQLACSTQNLPGTALIFQATGTPLYTAPINAYGTLLASGNVGASSLSVQYASAFTPGDYLVVNIGGGTAEIIKCGAAAGTSMTVSGFNFPHYIGETIFTIGRKFWAQITVPIGVTGGTPSNYIDLGLQLNGVINPRM